MSENNGWQPIATAPKQRTWMDAPTECMVYSPKFGIKMGRAWVDPDGHIHADATFFHGVDWGVTHWQPLPPAPVTQPTTTTKGE